MKLSQVERAILSNQYRILAILEPEQAEHYRLAETAFQNGYELDYGDFLGVYSDVVSEDDCREVLDILQMCRVLRQAADEIKDLDDQQRELLTFQGFDGNGETKHYAYAEWFCLERGRFGEFRSDFNSHMPMLPLYRTQLALWRKCADPNKPTAEELRAIADAR